MHKDFVFRRADRSDLDQIGVVGPAVYAKSYGHMWRDSEAQAYFRQLETFGTSAMDEFMARDGTATWVLEHVGRVVGLLTLVLGSPDPVEGRTDGAEVPRIYLLSPARGNGLAKPMLERVETYAREKGANHLWLDAMLEAPWAWKTYKKLGFEEIGRSTFENGIGPGFEPMVVLRRSI